MLFLPGADQRLFDRFHTLDYAMLRSNYRKEPYRCEVVDVSLSGLQIRSEHPLAIGEECELEIGLRKGEEFIIHGKVCYTNFTEDTESGEVYHSGIKFMPKTLEQRTSIAKYINSAFMRECPVVRGPVKKAA